MFAIVQNGQIEKIIQPHQEFTLNGTTYNAKWTVRMSSADKAKLGITPVYTQPRPDERFYWVQANEPKLVNGIPTINHTCIEKNPEELRTQFVEQEKAAANSQLAATDWMVIRKAERDVAIPDEVATERAGIIADCAAKEAAIMATTTLDELIDVVAPGATKAEDVIAYAEPPAPPEPEVVIESASASDTLTLDLSSSDTVITFDSGSASETLIVDSGSATGVL
jgi:hypothetical protein